eukprot:Phypoly_transcript_19852.p1 GENE.Phypoly_transcript_19852~~Phypoly_transcript_19852.p1  ORF type:complete len:212 (+),score=38.75 Phypoly_transcript_19852:2-637(+)
MKISNYLCLLLLFVFVAASVAKNTCAPDSPHEHPIPKEQNGVLPFCKQHQNLSCCDPTETKAIKRTVHELMDPKCPTCYQMVSEWKCSECHPNAGSFYQNERSSIKLCEDYCEHFFEICKDIPFDMQRDDGLSAFYLNGKAKTAEKWCRGNTASEGKCFRGAMPTTVDENCKCVDHLCHLQKQDKKEDQKETQKEAPKEAKKEGTKGKDEL